METMSFEVLLSFKGQTATILVTQETTADELDHRAREAFALRGDATLKLIWKGKVFDARDEPAFPTGKPGKKTPKVMVVASRGEKVKELNAGRSDPTIRGFDTERASPQKSTATFWGLGQNKKYKFCRFKACTWQSFGHRTGSKTPHAFEALRLLEKVATDPGTVAVMVERELVVGTLGEMDPIDDRLMQKKKTEGACLLGYNTNHGLRIDLKLRSNDLQGFLPYDQIAATLIHELSHNWVGEHNALFWTNYGQMRVEYLHKHASLAASGYLVDGRTTAQLAGVADGCKEGMQSIANSVIKDCSSEMAQHGIPVQAITPAILDRCRELTVDSEQSERGQRLGGASSGGSEIATTDNARELALAAAERRAQEKENKKDDKK